MPLRAKIILPSFIFAIDKRVILLFLLKKVGKMISSKNVLKILIHILSTGKTATGLSATSLVFFCRREV